MKSGERLGPYEILAPLGAGGMGEVWRARDMRLGRDVAVKVLPDEVAGDPRALARFQSEARAVAALSHPNILALFDVGEAGGIHYAVTELLQGETLRALLADGPLPVRRAVEIAGQIANALSAAHENGIVHQDVKPENVFLAPDGHVKLLDFGLARHARPPGAADDPRSPTETDPSLPGRVTGTVAYMSPEQARGEAIDFRSDQFSFGIVLYEILSGKNPFRKGTAPETTAAILREEPPDISESNKSVPFGLERIVRHCLEKEPDRRFQSTRDVVFALKSLPEPSAAGDATPMTPAGIWLHRHRKPLAALALFVAVVATGVLVFTSRKQMAGSDRATSVLALPCKVYGTPGIEYLTDAIPGTISTLLAGVAGLDTKVPPSSVEVERLKGDISKIADAYGVENVLLTTLTVQADRFILNAQLVNAATRKVHWGRQYEGPRSDFNALARNAAEGVLRAVSPAAASIPASPVSSEFELAFQEGRYLANRYDLRHEPAVFDAALRAYTRALELDPSSAKAAAEIARLHFARWGAGGEADREEERRQMESWARRALDLDPRCGEAWTALGLAAAMDVDWARTYEYALRAVRLAPRDAMASVVLAMLITMPGSELLGLASTQRAREIEPLYLPGRLAVAEGLLNQGRGQEALTLVDQALALEPDLKSAFTLKGRILTKLGRLAEAGDVLDRHEPPLSEANPHENWRFARLALALDERDAATVKSLEGPVFDLFSGKRTDICTKCFIGGAAYKVVPALARAGRPDDAFRILLRSVEVGMPPSYDWLLTDPDVQRLRGDPRFERVLAGSREAALLLLRVFDQARARGELPEFFEKPLEDFKELVKEAEAKS